MFMLMRTIYPGNWRHGDAVIHDGRPAHVMATCTIKPIPPAHVAICYDDESGCFLAVHAEELTRRLAPTPVED